jgi:hypothetical protein
MSPTPRKHHTLSAAATSYLDRLGALVRSVLDGLNVGHVPDFTIWPNASDRGAATRDAATFRLIPPSETVSLRKDKIKDGRGRTIRTAIVKAANGVTDTHKIADAWVILLSVLKYTTHEGRETNTPRSTASMAHDVFTAVFHAMAGYAAGAQVGKVADLKLLAETLKKQHGWTVEPTVKPVLTPEGKPKMKTDGKPATRTDWGRLNFPKELQALLAGAILDAEIAVDPPAEIAVDFLKYLTENTRSAGSTKYRTVTVKIHGVAVPLRITTKDVKAMIEAAGPGVDTFSGITIHLTPADVAAANAHKSRSEAAKTRARSKGALAGSVDETPRKGRKRAPSAAPPPPAA